MFDLISFLFQDFSGVNLLLNEVVLIFALNLGNILQIVSAPGQQIIRPQGSMVMQAMPQAVTASNAAVPASTPHPALSTSQQGDSFTPNTFNSLILFLNQSLQFHNEAFYFIH